MPRRPRNWVPDGIYHITIRGNRRQAIFHDAHDFKRYLVEMRSCQRVLVYRLIAFALMPNHVHLLMEAGASASLSDVMHEVSLGYTRYYNGRYGCVGQLYQGRFYSNHVNCESYLLEVSRYIHLNPVRAHLVQRAIDYPWSSFRFFVGLDVTLAGLIDPEPVLQFFKAEPKEQAERYTRFVEELPPSKQESWVRRLQRQKLVPPARYLVPAKAGKVPGTFDISDTGVGGLRFPRRLW